MKALKKNRAGRGIEGDGVHISGRVREALPEDVA